MVARYERESGQQSKVIISRAITASLLLISSGPYVSLARNIATILQSKLAKLYIDLWP